MLGAGDLADLARNRRRADNNNEKDRHPPLKHSIHKITQMPANVSIGDHYRPFHPTEGQPVDSAVPRPLGTHRELHMVVNEVEDFFGSRSDDLAAFVMVLLAHWNCSRERGWSPWRARCE